MEWFGLQHVSKYLRSDRSVKTVHMGKSLTVSMNRSRAEPVNMYCKSNCYIDTCLVTYVRHSALPPGLLVH